MSKNRFKPRGRFDRCNFAFKGHTYLQIAAIKTAEAAAKRIAKARVSQGVRAAIVKDRIEKGLL